MISNRTGADCRATLSVHPGVRHPTPPIFREAWKSIDNFKALSFPVESQLLAVGPNEMED